MKMGTDYIGIGVGAILQNSEGKFFLAQRGNKARNEKGCWEFPGGAVELGDTLEESIAREMKEEYGIQIKVIKHLLTSDHIIPTENQHWVGVTFLCTIVSGEPSIQEPEKCSDIGWFSREEIDTMKLSSMSAHEYSWVQKYM